MNPKVRQLLLGEQQWKRALPGVRGFISASYNQANPHNQSVMAAPPTVTAEGATRPASASVRYQVVSLAIDASVFRLDGGTIFNAGGNARIYSAVIGATGGNGGLNDGKQCSSWRIETIADAALIAFRVPPTSDKYRFIVDGQYVDLTGIGTVAKSGSTFEYLKVDFSAAGGKAVRRIAIEGQNTCGFIEAYVQSGETLSRPADAPMKLAVAGDSIAYGSAADELGDSFAWVCADTLGFRHCLASGSGGTGYVADGGGVVYRLSRRIANDINSKGPFDVIVLAMGVNDLTQNVAQVASEAIGCLAALRAGNPAAQIMVCGPWNPTGGAPTGYADIKAAIQAAIPPNCGIYFLDNQAISYTNTDGTHPDTAGHSTIGLWLAGAIKTALGA